MKKWLQQFKTEDWIIVFVGFVVLALCLIFPSVMGQVVMPKKLVLTSEWLNAAHMFIFILIMTYVTSLILHRPVRGIFLSLLMIFALALAAQLISNIPVCKHYGLEPVFFAVILGLLISNIFGVPKWMKPGIQSEFFIKVGIICLGSTIIFREILKSGAYGLAQALIVVFTVWYFAFWISKKFRVDPEMGTMLSSAVSICGVSAAIATSGVINGDSKKLSYVISLVLVIAIPMMYLMPWLSGLLGLSEEVAGAWMGGTIDTTGAVAASGTLLGETAAETAIIVKSSQNVLLGVAAFFISIYWSYRGKNNEIRPSAGLIWDRFPKFVVGFIIASLVFSFCLSPDLVKSVKPLTKGLSTIMFSIAFVCIGLETRFKDIFSKENRRALYAFLVAQTFNIFVTLIVAYLLFGVVKPCLG